MEVKKIVEEIFKELHMEDSEEEEQTNDCKFILT